jgi:hypothetical protein
VILLPVVDVMSHVIVAHVESVATTVGSPGLLMQERSHSIPSC